MKFSCCSIWRSSVAISPVAPYTSCWAWRTSRRDVTPPCSRTRVSRSDSSRDERPARDVELEVERAEIEVRAGDLTHQRRHHRAASPFAADELRARRFGGPPVSAPEIQLPRHRPLQLHRADVSRGKSQRRRWTLAEDACVCGHRRPLIRAGDSELRLRFENAHGGQPHVVVLLQRQTNQRLQRVVLEHVPPFRVAERRCGRIRRLAAKHVRRCNRRPLVVGPHRARREGCCHEQHHSGNAQSARESARRHGNVSPGTRSVERPCCGDRRVDSRSTSTKSSGMMKMAISVAASIPVTTTVPRIRRDAAPEPLASQSGLNPG